MRSFPLMASDVFTHVQILSFSREFDLISRTISILGRSPNFRYSMKADIDIDGCRGVVLFYFFFFLF